MNWVNCTGTNGSGGMLIDAVMSGDLTLVAFLLSCDKIDINHIDTNTGATALLSACERNNKEVFKLLIAHERINPNIANTKRGVTPLHVASEIGNGDMAKLLISHPYIELNKGRYTDGATPLTIASFHGHTTIVKELLNTFAINVNQARRDGWNALMLASKEGHSEIVAELLKSNEINVGKEPRNGGCALYEASKAGNADAVRSLLFHPDIEVNQVYNDVMRRTEFSSLQISQERGHLDVVILLLHCPKTDRTRKDRRNEGIKDKAEKINAIEVLNLLDKLESEDEIVHSCCSEQVTEQLAYATSNGDLEKVKVLSRCHEFEINKGHNGLTPLHIAARKGYNDLAGFFLEFEMIDVNKVDGIGNQVGALFYACINRHIDIVRQLVAFPDIDLNIQRAKDGATALHVVTEQDDREILKLLLLTQHRDTPRYRLDIKVNMGQDEGRTALMIASSAGQLGIMEMLLDHPNIDVNQLTNFDQITALYIACSNRQSLAVLLLLADSRTDVNKGLSSPLGASVGQRHTSMVKDILRCPKTSIEHATLHGIPVIKYAIQHGFSRIASVLQNPDSLLGGWKTCCRDIDKEMIRSAMIGHVVMLEELLKCPNSDINDQGEHKNALYIASELGHTDYVKKIISYPNIDINRKNTHYGKTALFAAAEKNNLEVIKVLTRHPEISMTEVRSSDVAIAFSIASEKGFFTLMMMLLRSHKELDVNAGWSREEWTIQTQNCKMELNDVTSPSPVDPGMKWAFISSFPCSLMPPNLYIPNSINMFSEKI